MNNFVELFSRYGTDNIFILVLLLIVAFFAGILSSLSPCSLGMLPLIIAYVGGYAKNDNKKLLVQMISFSIGLSIVLSVIGVICAVTGKVFTNIASPIFILLLGSILIILGLSLLGFIELPIPNIVKEIPQNKNGSLFILPFLVGTIFALASSPCSTPILAGIMTIATISTSIVFSICLFFCFALGQCLIIILAAIFTSFLKNTQRILKYSEVIMKASGILLIIVGLYLHYRILSNI